MEFAVTIQGLSCQEARDWECLQVKNLWFFPVCFNSFQCTMNMESVHWWVMIDFVARPCGGRLPVITTMKMCLWLDPLGPGPTNSQLSKFTFKAWPTCRAKTWIRYVFSPGYWFIQSGAFSNEKFASRAGAWNLSLSVIKWIWIPCLVPF